MASFRILNQAPQYFLPASMGGGVNAGGKLYFYENNTTTLKDTWSDEAMTVLNSNPVIMDTDGRTLTDVWGLDQYSVEMTTSADVVIWTRNNVKASGDVGTAIPALVAGEFLSNNGSVLLWDSVLQVPDPTGHADQVLYSDGALPYWAALPVDPTIPPLPDGGVVVTTTSFQLGALLGQVGTGTFPASGSQSSSVVVTFPTAFNAPPIGVWVQMGPGASMYLHARVDSTTATTASLSCDSNIISQPIVATQSFKYLAIGPVTVV